MIAKASLCIRNFGKRNFRGTVTALRTVMVPTQTVPSLNDVAQAWGRCNIDFQFMPRALNGEDTTFSNADLSMSQRVGAWNNLRRSHIVSETRVVQHQHLRNHQLRLGRLCSTAVSA